MTGGKSSPALMSVHDLSVELPTGRGVVRALDGISLDVAEGEALGVAGESGCGKTMLCKAVLGLLPRRSGVSTTSRIVFDGRDLTRLSPQALNRVRGREIAIVLQDPMTSLNPVMTVGAQIEEVLRLHLGLNRRKAGARAGELLESVGMPMVERRLRQYPHQLSGGLRQRVAIAIALACEPRLLLADEPTTALDVTVQAEILERLHRRRLETGMAMILVSHDLAVLGTSTDRIAVMYAGRIVESAPARDLFRGPRMPYTRALMDSVPRLDGPLPPRLPEIDGQPPDPARPRTGCAFAPRCPRSGAACHDQAPPLVENSGSGRYFACWRPLNPETLAHE